MGIINEVRDAENASSFLDDVLEYAQKFTPPNMASKAVGNIKRSVQTGAELPFQDALAVERELQQLLFQSSDAKEGIAAYVEKRKAEFKGR
jgi:enoyl-CoA hydratase/carnithine racemase